MNSNSVQSGHRVVQILCYSTEAMHVHGSVCIHEGRGGGGHINGCCVSSCHNDAIWHKIYRGVQVHCIIIEMKEVTMYVYN